MYVQRIMSGTQDPRRLPRLYWREMKHLKDAAVSIRLSRDDLGRRMRAVERIKAVASSGGIAGWVVWRDFPFLWAGIIVAAQLLDALKHVLPFSDQYTAASRLTVALEQLMVDAEDEWERIRLGTMPTDSIRVALNRLKQRRLKATQKMSPRLYTPSRKLLTRAASEASGYMQAMDSETESDG